MARETNDKRNSAPRGARNKPGELGNKTKVPRVYDLKGSATRTRGALGHNQTKPPEFDRNGA